MQGEKKKANPGDLKAKDTILKTAIALFAEKGYAATSIRDIASRSGWNLSLVSYYFGGKEGLYKACIESVSTNFLDLAFHILKPPNTVEEFRERLGVFVKNILSEQCVNFDGLRLVHREIEFGGKPLTSNALDVLLKPIRKVADFFVQAQERSLIRADVNAEMLADLMYSILSHQVHIDEIRERHRGLSIKQSQYRDRMADHVTLVFCNGLFQ